MICPINIISRISVQNKYAVKNSKTFSIINDIADIAKQLPRMPNPESFASVKSSCAPNSKGVVYRPHAVREALKFLKDKNSFFKNISIDSKLLRGDNEVEIDADVVDDEDIGALEESLNSTISTNTGTDNEIHEVFLSTSETAESEYEKLRNALGVPILVRNKGQFAHPMTTENFWPNAFPQLYPYGVGYVNAFGNSIKYIRYTLECGGLRDFQKYPSYIFARHHFEMQRKIGGVSAIASSKSWKINDIEQSNEVVTADDMLGIISTHREETARKLVNESEYVDSPARVKEVISQLTPFSQSIQGTLPYIQKMKQEILSMVNSPVILEHGDFGLFATVADSDLYDALLYAIATDTSNATTELVSKLYATNNITASLLEIDARKKILFENPALVCRVFDLKQALIEKYIIHGEDQPIGTLFQKDVNVMLIIFYFM
jgi:hypothetical protein